MRYDARKAPLTASGRFASVRDPETWSSYAEASASTVGEGVGYMLGNGIGCIDLDDCIRDDGTLHPVAERIVRENRRAALLIEISRSGRGLHVFRPMAEEAGSMRIIDGQDVEVYSRGRYIAMTGNRWIE